jgi:hypothetical protein
MEHDCNQLEFLGEVKEFIQNSKGLKATVFTVAIAVLIQVGTFLFLWGSLTTTVKNNTDQLWNKTIPTVTENTRNIDKILGKFELISVIRGQKGETGEAGKDKQ